MNKIRLEVACPDGETISIRNDTETSFGSRKIAEEVWRKKMNNEDDFEYSDNFRSAWLDDTEEMKKYIERYMNGCCGFFDVATMAAKLPEGETWDGNEDCLRILVMGFNHGH